MEAKKKSRLEYLDWLRGAGALVMLQGHVFHSFTKADLRQGGPYMLSQFVGGMPPAVFLFLTGVTLAFLMDARERQGLAPLARMTTVLRRSGYLFAMAFLFRFQLWVFAAPNSPWTDLLRVDILNCMGLAIAAMIPMALFRTQERIRVSAVLGLAIAAAAPLVSSINWLGSPVLLRDYIVPNPNSFSFFPWVAFVPFGIAAGSLLRIVTDDRIHGAMQWSALIGGALIMTAQYFASLPYSLYPKSDFWIDSPALTLIKLGVLLIVLPLAFLWTRYGAGEGWSWVRQLGTTSLLVYWVHIELVYGRWFYFWKERLNVGQTVGVAIAVTLLMLALSTAKTHWKQMRAAVLSPGWSAAAPRRALGD